MSHLSICRNKDNLQACAVKIPTLTTQLRILTSVKASTPDDLSVSSEPYSHCCLLFNGYSRQV